MQISCPRADAEIIQKPQDSYELCQIQRFHLIARSTRDTPVMRPGHESFAKNTTPATCAGRCARMVSLTDFLNVCARGLPHQRRHHHDDHLPHRQMDIIIVIVVAIIGSVIGRAVVISSSPPPSSSSLSSQSLSTSSCYRARPSHRSALERPRASAALETRWDVPIGNGDRGRISCAAPASVVE